MMKLNKNNLIAQAAAAKTPLRSDEHLPNVTIEFEDFAKQADLVTTKQLAAFNQPKENAWLAVNQLWEQWSKPQNQAAQAQLFSDCGFTVHGVFYDPVVMANFISASHLDTAFVTQQKNLMTVTVVNYNRYHDEQQVIFVLEFDAATPLAKQVLDYHQIRRELELQRDIVRIFGDKYQPGAVDRFFAADDA